MSKRLQVLLAVEALVRAALPGAPVSGLTNEDPRPERVGPEGLAIVRSGDPGPADIDLSPRSYNYDHDIPIELAAAGPAAAIDAMGSAIGAAVEADRFLGGLCHWLDVEAPTEGDAYEQGTAAIRWSDFRIVASYSTTSPLG